MYTPRAGLVPSASAATAGCSASLSPHDRTVHGITSTLTLLALVLCISAAFCLQSLQNTIMQLALGAFVRLFRETALRSCVN